MEQQHLPDRRHAVQAAQDGDLVVARKADSALDKLIALTDDPFHHIGIIVHRTVDGVREPWVVEHTFSGCTTRRLSVFLDHYDDVGVLFLDLSPSDRSRLSDTALSYLGATPRYAWDEVFLVGMYALVRERRNTKQSLHRCRTMRSIEAAIHRRNHSEQRAMFCTTFVVKVFADANAATRKQFGRLAPPPDSYGRGLDPTVFDRMMHWAIPFQMAAAVPSLVGLLAKATTNAYSGDLEEPPAMFSPSDYWRHLPVKNRWSRQGAENDRDPASVDLTPEALLPGHSEEQHVAA